MRDLSLYILDLVQNSITAKASLIKVTIIETDVPPRLTIEIEDNGSGMTDDQVKRVSDPFYTTRSTRKVGMGVPLFKMAAEITGGKFYVSSYLGVGTCFTAEFVKSSVNIIPLGDVNSVICLLIRCNPDIDFIYTRTINEKIISLDTRRLRKVLKEVPLDNQDVYEWISDFLES